MPSQVAPSGNGSPGHAARSPTPPVAASDARGARAGVTIEFAAPGGLRPTTAPPESQGHERHGGEHRGGLPEIGAQQSRRSIRSTMVELVASAVSSSESNAVIA